MFEKCYGNVLGIKVGAHVRVLFHHCTTESAISTPGTMGGGETELGKNWVRLTFQNVPNQHASACRRDD